MAHVRTIPDIDDMPETDVFDVDPIPPQHDDACGIAGLKFAEQFPRAAELASKAGLRLTHPSPFQYQLRHLKRGWLANIYLSTKKNPRIISDVKNAGPTLGVPSGFDLNDVVAAACSAWAINDAPARPDGPKKTLRDEFAMAALAGYSANVIVMANAIDGWDSGKGPRPTCIAEYLAGLSYEVADCMLKAREAAP